VTVFDNHVFSEPESDQLRTLILLPLEMDDYLGFWNLVILLVLGMVSTWNRSVRTTDFF
jgi:hypothetical protein